MFYEVIEIFFYIWTKLIEFLSTKEFAEGVTFIQISFAAFIIIMFIKNAMAIPSALQNRGRYENRYDKKESD